MLINAARRFPETAKLWAEMEFHCRKLTLLLGGSESNPKSGSMIIVGLVVVSAGIQTVVGTLITVLMDQELDGSGQTASNHPLVEPTDFARISMQNSTESMRICNFVFKNYSSDLFFR